MSGSVGGLFLLALSGVLFLLPLAAIILGIVGLIHIKRSAGRVGGAGYAWTGIVLGGLALLSLPVLAALLFAGASYVQGSSEPNAPVPERVEGKSPKSTPSPQVVGLFPSISEEGGLETTSRSYAAPAAFPRELAASDPQPRGADVHDHRGAAGQKARDQAQQRAAIA
jgi:hypothetical protein